VPLEANERGTDLWAMENDLVSMTPLELDLTDHDELAELEASVSLDGLRQPVAAGGQPAAHHVVEEQDEP
jgi:hypothetical protein